MISIQKLDDTTFKVTVMEATTTTHTVTITPSYYKKLAGNNVKEEELLRKSFEFLLERESNTSILRSFDLSIISQYFPEYEKTIQTMLK